MVIAICIIIYLKSIKLNPCFYILNNNNKFRMNIFLGDDLKAERINSISSNNCFDFIIMFILSCWSVLLSITNDIE